MKTGTASFGIISVLVIWGLSKVGVHLNPEEAATGAAAVVGGVAWVIHHGGLKGLWKAIVGGKP